MDSNIFESLKELFKPLIKEIPNSKTIKVDILFFLVSIVLGILGYWNFPAAFSVFFIQLILFMFIPNKYMIKQKYPFTSMLFYNVWAIVFLGIHAFIFKKYLLLFFINQFNQGVFLFVLFLGVALYREIVFDKQREKLYEYEEKKGDESSSGTGFFRYLPLWIMAFIIFTTNYFGIEIGPITLVIMFIVIVTVMQQIADADERLRWNNFLKQAPQPQAEPNF